MQLRALYEIPTVEIGERRSWTPPPEFFLRFPPQEHFPLLLNGPAARMERTIWHYAKRGRTEAVRSFLTPEAEVCVDELDDHGVTPLMVRIMHPPFLLPHTSTSFSTDTRPPPSPSSVAQCHPCAPQPTHLAACGPSWPRGDCRAAFGARCKHHIPGHRIWVFCVASRVPRV